MMKKYLVVFWLLGWIPNLNAQEAVPVKMEDKQGFISCVIMVQCWDEGAIQKGSFFTHPRIAPALQQLLTKEQFRQLVNNIGIQVRESGDDGQAIIRIGFCPELDYLDYSYNYPEACAKSIIISFSWRPFLVDPKTIDGFYTAILGNDGQGGKLQLLFLPEVQDGPITTIKPARYWQDGMKQPVEFDDLPTVGDQVKQRCQDVGLFDSAQACLRGLEESFTHPLTYP